MCTVGGRARRGSRRRTVAKGRHAEAVQRMLGHASAAMTRGAYADLPDDELDGVATRLNDQVVLVVAAVSGYVAPRRLSINPSRS